MRFFDAARLDRAFVARSVAVIGPSQANGYFWLQMFETFAGPVSSVHVNPDSIREIKAMRIPNYRSILDVPRPVDYVVVNTPRRLAVETFARCIEADVGAVSFSTSGFGETDDEGRSIQARLTAMSRESGIPLLGPNCTGIYNPTHGMSSMTDMPLGEAGPVAMVSQSGTHAGFFAKALFAWHGIREARGVSFGNGAALDAADWIEYLGADDQVRVLAAYIEGIGDRSDHDRFVDAVRTVTETKPVVIWKGGNTADGARVTGNHTGAMPGCHGIHDHARGPVATRRSQVGDRVGHRSLGVRRTTCVSSSSGSVGSSWDASEEIRHRDARLAVQGDASPKPCSGGLRAVHEPRPPCV